MFPKARDAIARTGVGLAISISVLGMFISFVPGAETAWFGTGAGLAALGLLSPSWRVRAVALGMAIVCAQFAWGGYHRGLEYQEWLRAHRPA
jgi:hypothetical protein